MSQSLSPWQWRLKRPALVEERWCREGGEREGDKYKGQLRHTFPTHRQLLFRQSGLERSGVLAVGDRMKKWTYNKCIRHCTFHPMFRVRKLSLKELWSCLQKVRGEVRIQTQVCLAEERWSAFSELLEMPFNFPGRASQCSGKDSDLATKWPEWSGQSWFKINFIVFKKGHWLTK